MTTKKVTKTTKVKPTPVEPKKIPRQEIDALKGFTPRVERLKNAWLNMTSLVSSDRGYYYMESWKTTEGQHESVRVAKMFRNWCEKSRIDIRDDELLVGGLTHWARGSQPRPESQPVPLLVRLKEQEEKLHTVSLAVSCKIEEYDLKRLEEACEYFQNYFETMRKRRGDRARECRLTPVNTPYDKARRMAVWAMRSEPGSEGQVIGLPIPSLVIKGSTESLARSRKGWRVSRRSPGRISPPRIWTR